MAKKFLFAFDFDHTLLDANSDMTIQQAYNTYPVPEYLRIVGVRNSVVCYLHETFRFHYPMAVGKSEFHHTLNKLPLVHGLHDCIEQLHKLGGELIVISDANNYFITHVLKHQNLLNHFAEVFSNPAEFDEKGQLVIRPYMSAECKLSSKNLCKGKVLKDYVKMRKSEGQKFAFVAFAGDGVNDFCPMRTLRKMDMAFPRAGYSIVDMIAKQSQGLPLRCEVALWRSGHDIVRSVKAKLEHLDQKKANRWLRPFSR